MDWIPKVGDLAMVGNVIFPVVKRTRTRDRSGEIVGVKLWNGDVDQYAQKYDLSNCEPVTLEKLQALKTFQVAVHSNFFHSQLKTVDNFTYIAIRMEVEGHTEERVLRLPAPSEITANAVESFAQFFQGSIIADGDNDELLPQWR